MEKVMGDFTLTGFETWGLLLISLIVVLAAARRRYHEIREQCEHSSVSE
jgi:hypothetical protein